MIEVLEQVNEWFFPSGRSRRGKATDYHMFITDATHTRLDHQTTIEEMYCNSKCKMLRLYLASQKKQTIEYIGCALPVRRSKPLSISVVPCQSEEANH